MEAKPTETGHGSKNINIELTHPNQNTPSSQSQINAKEIELLKKEMESLKQQMEELTPNLSPTSSTPKDEFEVGKIKYLDEASKDDRKGTVLKVLRFLILFIFVVIYFGYEYFYLYLDEEYNQLSQSSLVQIEETPMPYFYIYGGGYLTNMSVQSVYLEIADGKSIDYNSNGTGIEYKIYQNYNYNDSLNSNSFVYNESITEWTSIEMLHGTVGTELFVVPPYGFALPVDASIKLILQCFQVDAYNVDDDTDYDYTDELTQMYTNGDQYGVFWDIESISEIKNQDLFNVKQKYFDSWERLRYTFVATRNYYSIDIFEENNKLKNTNKLYYTTSYIASIIDEEYTAFHSDNENIYSNFTNFTHFTADGKVWWYWTELNLYINPSGGGLKTVLTISQYKTITDILANVGGLFSPLNTFSFLLVTWLIFGMHFGSKIHLFNGIASLSQLSYSQRKQFKVYLIQLGLLNNVNENENENKL